jgi:hypothetical protein
VLTGQPSSTSARPARDDAHSRELKSLRRRYGEKGVGNATNAADVAGEPRFGCDDW